MAAHAWRGTGRCPSTLLPAPADADAGEPSPSPLPPGAIAKVPPCGVLSSEPLGLVPLVPGPLVPGADVPLLLDSPASTRRADLRLPSHMYSTARAQQPGSATTPNRLGGQGQEHGCGQGEHTTTQNMGRKMVICRILRVECKARLARFMTPGWGAMWQHWARVWL